MGYSQSDAAAKSAADAAKQAAIGRLGKANPLSGDFIDAAKDIKSHDKDYSYRDPGAAEYGGEGGVDLYRAEALKHKGDNNAQQASNRSAMATSIANMKGADSRSLTPEDPRLAKRAADARGQQIDSLNLNRDAALGKGPSEADYQTRIGMNNLVGARAGALGGAHGLAGLTGAQGGFATDAGANSGNIAAQGGIAQSSKVADAIGMYGTQAGAVRQGDFNRLGISNQNTLAGQGNNLDWKLGNANLATSQAGLGVQQNANDLAWQGEAMKPADTQFRYDQEMAAAANGANVDAASAQIARNRESRDAARNMVNGGITAGLTMAGSAAGPAGAAAGSAAGGMMGSATSRYW